MYAGCGSISSRAPGVNSNPPRFAHFLVVPTTSAPATLAWSVARATSVTIAGVGTFNSPTNSPTGTVDVRRPVEQLQPDGHRDVA